MFVNYVKMYCKTETNTLYSAGNIILLANYAVTGHVSEYYVSLCLVWFGVIFIRHGLYQDGVFKFTVYIPDNYPDGDCPVSSVILTNGFWTVSMLSLGKKIL